MASITRKSEKTVATVTAAYQKITVSVPEKLTIDESKELRALLKTAEKDAADQSNFFSGFDLTADRFFGHAAFAR